ncbi:hypothetical protein M1373_03390 [Candidatus Marsarchaeota archaeon]|nr:hypothetical protein [Candidatus Marsarchaeota archaeon]MCL5404789.1 hypothetical protein [Candidatus Marsarchaeota archaeon]
MHKSLKAQSAIEFITTYGTVLLIIAIVISVLFLFISLPKSLLPTECNFYNTFGCYDSLYGDNSSGTILLVVANFQEPGIVNISNFSANINSVSSTSGYCAPRVALQGQKVYCLAYFAGKKLAPGAVYSGTFSMFADYCAVAPSEISTAYCPPPNATSHASFGGYIRTNGVNEEIGGIYAVPVNINVSNFNFFDYILMNFIEPGYQVRIDFNPENVSYKPHEVPNLGNIRFFYKNEELYDWCENCNESMTSNAIFWVKLPPGTFNTLNCFFGTCPSNVTIFMYFTPLSTQFTGVHSGLAPQLTPVYGQYDNGEAVFNYYTDFAGTGVPANWVDELGDNYTIDNGAFFSGTTLLQKVNDFPLDLYNLTEARITLFSAGAGGIISGINGTGKDNDRCGFGPYNDTWIYVGHGTGQLCYGETFGLETGNSTIAYFGTPSGVSSAVPSTGTFTIGLGNSFSSAYYFYNSSLQTDGSLPGGIFGYFGIENKNADFKVSWVRSITMLSGGAMPTITFGPIQKEPYT